MSLFESLFGKWADLLVTTNGPAFTKPISFLSEEYETKKNIIPAQKDVFKAFNMVDPTNLKVVIVGMDPYPTLDGAATGYAFANPVTKPTLSPSLRLIRNRIEQDLYNGLLLDFDPTLSHWAEQGVLAINAAFTVLAKKPGSHQELWKPFTTALLRDLNSAFEGLYFCFWGKVAQEFAPLINPDKHTKLFAYHPAYATYRGVAWECDHFIEINKKLSIKW